MDESARGEVKDGSETGGEVKDMSATAGGGEGRMSNRGTTERGTSKADQMERGKRISLRCRQAEEEHETATLDSIPNTKQVADLQFIFLNHTSNVHRTLNGTTVLAFLACTRRATCTLNFVTNP